MAHTQQRLMVLQSLYHNLIPLGLLAGDRNTPTFRVCLRHTFAAREKEQALVSNEVIHSAKSFVEDEDIRVPDHSTEEEQNSLRTV
jgi:hypothetical protein